MAASVWVGVDDEPTQSPVFTGQASFANGGASAPSITFASDTNSGLYNGGNDELGFSTGAGSGLLMLRNTGFTIGNGGFLSFAGAGSLNGDAFLVRDAANTLAQRNGTSAQEYRPYGYYASATGFTAGIVKSATASVTLAGASTTSTNIIPVGSFVIGVATTTTTTITGASGYTVGDGTDVDRWGDITGTAVGTDSDNTNSTANPTGYFAAAQGVTLTAKTSNFTGGVVQVTVFYLTTGAD